MRDLKLLQYRNDGKMAYYSLRDELAGKLVTDTRSKLESNVAESPLRVVQEQITEAIRAPKCHRCGCLQKTVEALVNTEAGQHETPRQPR